MLRAAPGVSGRVASDATVSRTIDALAANAPAALRAIDATRAAGRKRVWALAGAASRQNPGERRADCESSRAPARLQESLER